MKKTFLCFLCGCLTIAIAVVSAQEQAEENPVHDELRGLKSRLVEAIQNGNTSEVLQNVHTNVVVTWQNNTVCRGTNGLYQFLLKTGHDAFKEYKIPPTPDELTILLGDDTGISFGKTVALYNLFGKEYELESRWTATLVKENDRWLLAAYHISMNVLDNPLLNTVKGGLYWSVGIALLAGLIVGLFVGRRSRVSKSRTTDHP